MCVGSHALSLSHCSHSFSFPLRSTFILRFVESYDFISRALRQLHTGYEYALLQRRGAALLVLVWLTVYAHGTVHTYVD